MTVLFSAGLCVGILLAIPAFITNSDFSFFEEILQMSWVFGSFPAKFMFGNGIKLAVLWLVIVFAIFGIVASSLDD